MDKLSNMKETTADINERIARRVHGLRQQQGLSLEALAQKSEVSRSMISLIERGESSPTAVVLDRLATALGVTLAHLFEDDAAEANPLSRRADQAQWQDPDSGYVRRNLSPLNYPSPIRLVEVELPPGARVAYETTTAPGAVQQQIWLIEGALELRVGDTLHALKAGDCLAMTLDERIAFHNPGRRAAHYLVALVSR